MQEQSKISRQIDRHIQNWRAKIVNPTAPGNTELAEENIRELYRLYKKDRPCIIWCESPYQLAAIPPVVHILQQTTEWRTLVEQVHSARAAGQDWLKTWESEWKKLEKFVTAINLRVVGTVRWVNKSTRARSRSKIKETMYQVMLQNRAPKLAKISLDSADGLQLAWGHHAEVDTDFMKRRFALKMRVEKIAQIKFVPGLDAMQNLMMGNFDTRLISFFLPATDELINPRRFPKETYAEIRKVKILCSELEPIAQRLSNWFAGLPIFNRVHGNFSTVWLPYSLDFLPFALSCRLVKDGFFGALQKEIDCWAYLSHAACGYYFTADQCFVCPRPIAFYTNEQQRPHNPEGAAAVWSDGYEVYSWKGLVVDPPLIQNKDLINIKKIKSSRNIERRRTMIDIYGEARFLEDAGASLVAEDEYGSLYKLPMSSDETITMVKVRNSTPEPDGTYKIYFLRVPPDTVRPRQGIAWTFGLTEEEYSPNIES